jgi:hypothetical protein
MTIIENFFRKKISTEINIEKYLSEKTNHKKEVVHLFKLVSLMKIF